MRKILIVFLAILAAGCSSGMRSGSQSSLPQMDPTRQVSVQDCSRSSDADKGNLMCREVTAAEVRARLEEEARPARAKKEAAERAERERLERERAEQLAREEAARKARIAEEERLAAERRRAEEEAARKAREEQERKEAEARARREALEAAARECRRLEQERNDGRAQLENFVGTYGKVGEFKEVSGQITAFLAKPRNVKPCPPAP